jgi:hypothetical protein
VMYERVNMHDKKAKTKHQSRTRVTTVDRPGVAGTPLNAPRETAERRTPPPRTSVFDPLAESRL